MNDLVDKPQEQPEDGPRFPPCIYFEDRLHGWLKYMYQKHEESGMHRWLVFDSAKNVYSLMTDKPDDPSVREVATTRRPGHL